MGLFSRSDRKFNERAPRVAKPVRYAPGNGPAEFVYYPLKADGGRSSMGFPLASIPPASRVAAMFEAEYGVTVEEARSVPGWRPATHGRPR